ncbi:hypothetical protein MKW92_053041 [Papaver armeniacum]|nr:hypothetical protein MKW92_053041 [Papaver armeniacum]
MAIIEQMIELKIKPTMASYNVVLEAMFESKDSTGVEKLVTRMEKAKESMLDDESYTLIVGLFLAVEEIDGAFIHIYIAMNSGCMVSMPVFTECVICAIRLRRFGLLTTILEEYMTLDERKAPCLPWGMFTFILKASLKEDYIRLASCLLEYLEHKFNPQELISQKKVPSAESYLVNIYAYSSSKEFEKALATLKELECAYGDSDENLFCPFTSLSPLVIALSKGGVGTLDSVIPPFSIFLFSL